jgi:hypothetical protein
MHRLVMVMVMVMAMELLMPLQLMIRIGEYWGCKCTDSIASIHQRLTDRWFMWVLDVDVLGYVTTYALILQGIGGMTCGSRSAISIRSILITTGLSAIRVTFGSYHTP